MATLATFTNPAGTPFFLQLTYEGWRHGRNTPPLTLVDWYELWDESIDEIRDKVGIAPYKSLIPDMPLPTQ